MKQLSAPRRFIIAQDLPNENNPLTMIWKAAFSLQFENILLLVEEEASTPRLAGNKMLFLEGLGGENSEELLQSKQ